MLISVGPSSDPYGLSIVDSIKVYVQSKSEFGLKDGKLDISQEENILTEATLKLESPLLYSERFVVVFLSK